MTKIICYMGGSCGDLVTAFFDMTQVAISDGGAVLHAKDRIVLKKPHTTSIQDKLLFLQQCRFKSVPSHALDFHVAQTHEFFTVSVKTLPAAMWAAARFRALHRPIVWQEMSDVSGASTVEAYAQTLLDYSNMVAQHTNKVVQLEYILDGSAIDKIKSMCDCELDPAAGKFYLDWLAINEKLCNTGQGRSQYQD